MSLEPRDLPRLRGEMLGAYTLQLADADDPKVRAALDEEGRGHVEWSRTVRGVLERAELFWVSSEMASVAQAASTIPHGFDLLPEDLPAPTGLVVFEHPVFLALDNVSKTGIAYTWTRIAHPERHRYPRGALLVSLYTADESETDWVKLIAHMYLPFGRYSGASANHANAEVDALLALFLLMKQPLIRVTEERIPRADARRHFRAYREDPAPIRVVRLRSPRAESGERGDRDWHHRWVVRGHWRQQWYPSLKRHKPIWVTPYVKGPEDAPLLGGEKVYAVTR